MSPFRACGNLASQEITPTTAEHPQRGGESLRNSHAGGRRSWSNSRNNSRAVATDLKGGEEVAR